MDADIYETVGPTGPRLGAEVAWDGPYETTLRRWRHLAPFSSYFRFYEKFGLDFLENRRRYRDDIKNTTARALHTFRVNCRTLA